MRINHKAYTFHVPSARLTSLNDTFYHTLTCAKINSCFMVAPWTRKGLSISKMMI